MVLVYGEGTAILTGQEVREDEGRLEGGDPCGGRAFQKKGMASMKPCLFSSPWEERVGQGRLLGAEVRR